jgi:hypothetical protein
MPESKSRTVRKIIGYDSIEIDFMDLRKGDLFTLTESDGTPVRYNERIILDALGDPYINDKGVGEILMKDYLPLVLH